MWDIKNKLEQPLLPTTLYYLNHVGYKGLNRVHRDNMPQFKYYLNHVGYKEEVRDLAWYECEVLSEPCGI